MKTIDADEARKRLKDDDLRYVGLDTFTGIVLVTSIDRHYRATAPLENAGNGRTYHLNPGSRLKVFEDSHTTA